jgi:hypothetical protein
MVITSTNKYFFYEIGLCRMQLIGPNWWEYVSEHPRSS